MILLDTNILTRVTRPRDELGLAVRRAIHRQLLSGRRLVIVPQNLYEFWAVATRPAGHEPGQNGLGLTIEQVGAWVNFFMRRFTLLPDHPDLTKRWLELVQVHQVRGFRAHDVRLVAAMRCYGITDLLTLNAKDFRDFDVVIRDPVAM